MTDPLDAVFRPRAIAVIGASSDPGKIGGRPIRFFRLGGFAGPVYPINPGRAEIQGYPAYPSLDDVPGEVDLTIVAVPALQVEDAMAACARKGVRAAIVFSAGFAETGPEGRALQDRMEAAAQAGGVRIIGPNCMGAMNMQNGMLATFTSGILDRPPPRGRISIASQSGALGAHCWILAGDLGLALNLWVTTGNQCDIDVADCLAYMAADPGTDVILACIEGIAHPERFIAALAAARAARKPVIVMKVGRSEVGQQALASHTASLAGSDRVFDALLRQHGAYRARTIDEMFDVTYACSRGRFPQNRDLGLITVSGGVGIMMADAAADHGLLLPELSPATQAFVREKVPFAGTRNPLDVTAQVVNQPDLVEPIFDAMVQQGGHGSIVAFLTYIGRNPGMMAKLIPGLARVAAKAPDLPLFVSLVGTPEIRAELEAAGYLVFEEPTRAVRAAAALATIEEGFRRPPTALPDAGLLLDAAPVMAGRTYSETEAKRLLASAGIPVVADALAADAEAAAREAARLGFPVVLKIASPDIAHKSEIGGVLLGVRDEEAARDGFELLMGRARIAAPDARIDGVAVAPMIQDGVETILGIVRDPVFGHAVMLGLGGIFTEVFEDVSFRLVPIGESDARAMIEEVRGKALLRGARGRPRADEDALAHALVRLSCYAEANAAALDSIDVNPFLVRPQGRGAVAVDALVLSRPGSQTS